MLPARSFFLFGPRGTSKTTWLRSVLPDAHWVDLLLERDLVRFTRDADRFGAEVEALPRGRWVVIDEVQRVPALLDRYSTSSCGIRGDDASRSRGRAPGGSNASRRTCSPDA